MSAILMDSSTFVHRLRCAFAAMNLASVTCHLASNLQTLVQCQSPSLPSARPPCYVLNPAASAVKHALRMNDVTDYDGSEVDYEASEVLGEVGEVGEKTLQR